MLDVLIFTYIVFISVFDLRIDFISSAKTFHRNNILDNLLSTTSACSS